MKARRWNIKEDEMVCLFYLQHITDFLKENDLIEKIEPYFKKD